MIAVMGGAFDPVHFGHLRPALEIAEALSLQAVRLIPAGDPPLKQAPQCTADHRLQMLRLATSASPVFELDKREVERGGASYTVDTLRELAGEYPHETLVFILGADAFVHFQRWKDWQTILQLAHLVVSHRPGYQLERTQWPGKYWAETAEDFSRYRAGKILPMAVTQLEISSTFIRACIAKGQNIQFLLPEKVRIYIKENRLYQSS